MSIQYAARAAAIMAAMLCAGTGRANESDTKIEAPGFRPESESAQAFVEKLASSEIAVFPAIVRSAKGISYVTTFPGEAIAFMARNDLGKGRAVETALEPGETNERVQFKLFQASLRAIGGQLGDYQGDGDYVLVTEYLITGTRSGGMAVGGIHCYILDRSGANAFSFLLNSHHQPFVDALLRTSDSSAEAEKKLIAGCTKVALGAFQAQVERARAGAGES